MGGFVVTVVWKTVFSANGGVIYLEKCRLLVLFLNCNGGYVLHSLQMIHCNTDFAVIFFCSSGINVLSNIGSG